MYFSTEWEEAEALPDLLEALSLEVNASPQDTRKAAKGVPTGEFVASLFLNGVFTHSNRLIDGRNQCLVHARYGTLGDVRADNTLGVSHRDIQVPAADMPKAKTLMAPYRVAGCVTNLLEAVLEGRPAGKRLCDLAALASREPSDWHDPLDKSVLVPVEDGYVDIRPKTPAYLPVAMKRAIFEVAAKRLSEAMAVEAKHDRWPVMHLQARGWCIPKPQNLSFHLNAIGGQIFHTLFLPPPIRRPESAILRRMAREWEDTGFQVELLKPVLSGVLESSGLIYRIAHEKRRHSATGDIRDMAAVDNRATKNAFMDCGRHVGMVVRMTLAAVPSVAEDGRVAQERRRLFEDHENDALVREIWNVVSRQLAANYGIDRQYDWFARGFAESFWFGGNGPTWPVQRRRFASSARLRDMKAKGGHYLSIVMQVDAHDAGTAGPSLGMPAPTAIYGFLHRIVERGAGLKMRRFMPIVQSCRIHDPVARRFGIAVKVTEQAKKDAKTVLGQDDLVIYSDDMAHVIVGKATPVYAPTPEKAAAPPLQNEIKADTALVLVVELMEFVDAEDAASVLHRLHLAIRKAHLAGGIIRDAKVRLHQEAPSFDGFALLRHDFEAKNPLHELIESVAFVGSTNRRYVGRYPIGLLACGYEGIRTAKPVSRRGEVYPAQHAETIYWGFRFVGARHPDAVWFEPECRKRGDLYDFQLHC